MTTSTKSPGSIHIFSSSFSAIQMSASGTITWRLSHSVLAPTRGNFLVKSEPVIVYVVLKSVLIENYVGVITVI